MSKIGLIVLCLAITSAFAEPPRYRQRQQFERQEMDPSNGGDGTVEGTTQKSGPYPPAGWKPSKQQLTLPQRQSQQQPPNTLYGAPAPPQTYGPPATEYGPPQEESTTTMSASDASEGNEITEEPESENVDIVDIPAQVKNPAKDVQNSLFYVQVPRQQLVYVPVAQPIQRSGLFFQRLQVQPQPLLTTNQIILPGQAVSYSAQYQSW